MRSPALWISTAIGTFAVLACSIVCSSYLVDVFGLFAGAKDSVKEVQHNERTAKFFLNERYVPARYNALFIGGSSTSNWPMQFLRFSNFYNESIYGSNYVEEKRLVDQALRRGRFRYAICLINPYPMATHDYKEGNAKPKLREALGSVNVLREEFYLVSRKLRKEQSPFWPDGGESMPAAKGIADPYATYEFNYDADSLQALSDTLDELRANGAQIIFVETPVYEPIYRLHKAQLDQFYAKFPLRRPDELLVDFGAPQYEQFRLEASRWVDPPHLNDASAAEATIELDRVIELWLHENRRRE